MTKGGRWHRPGCSCPFCTSGRKSEVPSEFSLVSDDGATPIDHDAAQALRPEFRSISTRGELNAAEARSVTRGILWLDRQPEMPLEDFSSIGFQLELHRRMFGDIWTWAGKIRTQEMSIGIAPEQIQSELYKLSGDLLFWADSGMEPTEVCARFHHRQVQIHPFVNGNGRHSRVYTEYLAGMLGLDFVDNKRLTWGSDSYGAEFARKRYLAALREADKGDYRDLIDIAQR